MNRGDIVAVAMAGDYGKPRPALIVQSDLFSKTDSISLLLITSDDLNDKYGRIPLAPDQTNGLRKMSYVMVDKTMTVHRDRVGRVIGQIDGPTMSRVNRSLGLFLGIM